MLLSYLGILIQFITPQNFGSGVFFDINYINPVSHLNNILAYWVFFDINYINPSSASYT